MRQWINRSVVGLLLVGLAATACDDGDDLTGVDENVQIESITLTTPRDTLSVGETTQLSVTVFDDDGDAVSNPTLEFTSSSEAVATVSSTGLVTAVGTGAATITARSGSATANVTITVIASGASTVELDRTDLALAVGDTTSLQAIVRDEQGNVLDDVEVTFSSEDEAVVTTTSDGRVTAIGQGSTRIAAEADGVTAFSNVNVDPAVVGNIDFTLTRSTFVVGDTARAEVVALNQNGNPLPQGSVSLTSDDAAVVTIDSEGLVTAIGTGTTTLRATAGGQTATLTVDVVAAAESLQVLPATQTISLGRTIRLNVVLRDQAGNRLSLEGREAVFESSDTSVLTVDADGDVTAVGRGTATVTVTVEGLTDTSVITVI